MGSVTVEQENNKFNLDIDNLYKNQHAKVIISTKTPISTSVGNGESVRNVFTGFIKGDFSISMGSQYATLLNLSSLQQASDALQLVQAALGGTKVGSMLPNIRLLTPGMTQMYWTGVQSPEFSIQLDIVKTRSNGPTVTNIIKELYRTVLPTESSGIDVGNSEGWLKGLLTPPLGYTPGSQVDIKPKGTMWIQIGKWFQAPYQIMTNVSFDISRIAASEKGDPLYASGQISFRPYRDITWDMFNKYFRV